MKNAFYGMLIFALMVASCHSNNTSAEEEEVVAHAPVQVVHLRNGSINDHITLSGTTVYLKRNVVTAQIPAFILRVNVKLGDKVEAGAVLYELETKERRAMGVGANGLDTGLQSFGIIKVTAPASGIISTLDKQQVGDYVLEGTQLCTIAESNDLAFQVNVPYEFSKFAVTGSPCSISLPDNSVHAGVITTPLTSMNAVAQTQPMLAKVRSALFLPEGLIVKVQLNRMVNDHAQILPKGCVLSDEMMTEYWVMKLINDSVAVKVPVIIGNKSSTEIEILQPQFNAQDRLIVNGNYGLADTALVKVNP